MPQEDDKSQSRPAKPRRPPAGKAMKDMDAHERAWMARRSSETFNDSIGPIRHFMKVLYNEDKLSFIDEPLFDALRVEFGLSRREAGHLSLTQLRTLLNYAYKLRNSSTEPQRQSVLKEIAKLRMEMDDYEPPPDQSTRDAWVSFNIARKALAAFPEPDETIVASGTKAVTTRMASISNEQADVAARSYLGTSKNKSLRGCANFIQKHFGGKFAASRVVKLPAWKDHMKAEESRAQRKSSKRPLPFTEEMEAAKPGTDDDPALIAEANERLEIARRRCIEAMDGAERARFHKLSEAEQIDRISTFLTDIDPE